MTEELPFSVSIEAMQFLMQLPTSSDRQPGFVCSPRYGVFRGHDLVEEFVGDHFSFSFATPHEWLGSRAATAFTIGERPFWITPDILAKLSGTTLSVVESDVAVGGRPACIRKFLIPSEPDPRANKGAAGKPPGSPLSAMTHRNSNPQLAFHALPRPEAASA